MTTKYTFKQEFNPNFNPMGSSTPTTITMEINGEQSLDQLVSRFEEFLRGAGFYFNGHLDFVDDDEIPQDYNVNGDADINLDDIHIYGEPSVSFGSMDNMSTTTTTTFNINSDGVDHSVYYYDKDRNK